jgi:CRISPR system Cascade subunit CasB
MSDLVTETKISQFVARLEDLDPGDRARLKRNAGRTLADARDATGLFYRILLPDTPPYLEEVYFLVATLFPLADGKGVGNLGAALRRAQNDKNRKGLDRRVEILLDADLSQLPFRLRQAIHFLQSNRVRVNWVGLLEDLLHWNHPDRFVQQSWARSYYTTMFNHKSQGE